MGLDCGNVGGSVGVRGEPVSVSRTGGGRFVLGSGASLGGRGEGVLIEVRGELVSKKEKSWHTVYRLLCFLEASHGAARGDLTSQTEAGKP